MLLFHENRAVLDIRRRWKFELESSKSFALFSVMHWSSSLLDCMLLFSNFIPEHNMIDGDLSHADLAYLSSILDKMNMRKNWKIMFSVPSLRNFRNFPISIKRKPYRLSEFDEVVLSLKTASRVVSASFEREKNSIICMYSL